MGIKDRGMWENTYAERGISSGHAQEDFGKESVGQDICKVQIIKGSVGGKGSTAI